jgi:hypothetical protein
MGGLKTQGDGNLDDIIAQYLDRTLVNPHRRLQDPQLRSV